MVELEWILLCDGFFQVLATCLTRIEFVKGVMSSGALFCYWLIFVVVYIVPFRSNILHITYTAEVLVEL